MDKTLVERLRIQSKGLDAAHPIVGLMRAAADELERLQSQVTAEDMAAFGASEVAGYRYPEVDQQGERNAFCAGAASMVPTIEGLREALQSAEDADDAREACDECGGDDQWEHCGACSERFGNAIVARRAALNRRLQSQAPWKPDREQIARVIYARNPIDDQNTDLDGRAVGEPFEYTYEQIEECWPEHHKWLTDLADAILALEPK